MNPECDWCGDEITGEPVQGNEGTYCSDDCMKEAEQDDDEEVEGE